MAINIPQQTTLMDHLASVGRRYVENKALMDRERQRQEFESQENQRQRNYLTASQSSKQGHEMNLFGAEGDLRRDLFDRETGRMKDLATLDSATKIKLLKQAGLNDAEIQNLENQGAVDQIVQKYVGEGALVDKRYAGEKGLQADRIANEQFLAGPEMRQANLLQQIAEYQFEQMKKNPLDRATETIKPYADVVGISPNEALTGKSSRPSSGVLQRLMTSLPHAPGQPAPGIFPFLLTEKPFEDRLQDLYDLQEGVATYDLIGQGNPEGYAIQLDEQINQ